MKSGEGEEVPSRQGGAPPYLQLHKNERTLPSRRKKKFPTQQTTVEKTVRKVRGGDACKNPPLKKKKEENNHLFQYTKVIFEKHDS